jgi:hypothetical protein
MVTDRAPSGVSRQTGIHGHKAGVSFHNSSSARRLQIHLPFNFS